MQQKRVVSPQLSFNLAMSGAGNSQTLRGSRGGDSDEDSSPPPPPPPPPAGYEGYLPYPWVSEFNAEHGLNYFVNSITGEMSWEPPREFEGRGGAAGAGAMEAAEAGAAGAGVAESGPSPVDGGGGRAREEGWQEPVSYINEDFEQQQYDEQYRQYEDDPQFDPQYEQYDQQYGGGEGEAGEGEAGEMDDSSLGGQSRGTTATAHTSHTHASHASSASVVSGASGASGGSVVERSAAMLASRHSKAQAMREQREALLTAQIRPPQINTQSRGLSRSVKDIYAWEERRRDKVERLGREARDREQAHMTGKPTLVSMQREGQGGGNAGGNAGQGQGNQENPGLPVGDRLYQEEAARRQRWAREAADRQAAAKAAAIPTLAPHSATLVRSADHTAPTAAALGHYATSSAGVGVVGGGALMRDQATGQIMFQPRLNRTTELLTSNGRPRVPVEVLLQARGQEAAERVQQRRDREALREQQLRAPRVNGVSQRLAREREVRETAQMGAGMGGGGEAGGGGSGGGDSDSLAPTLSSASSYASYRLQKPIGRVSKHVLQDVQQSLPSFRPAISKSSADILAAEKGQGRYSHESISQLERISQVLRRSGDYGEYGNDESGEYGEYGDSVSMGAGTGAGAGAGPLLYEDLLELSRGSKG
ncbi:hypothetical protein B484DRAFT_468229, partial [Ochromonadaceae sp. CCMP2298]